MRIGYYKPFGYFVHATEVFDNNTLICEYVGELGNGSLFQSSDEMLSLGKIALNSTELVINTQRYANIGRFVLGLPKMFQ